MLQTDNSIRGKVMRELIARVASDNLIDRKLKSGELRKKMTEPEWRVPEFYNLRVIEEKNCRLELLECDIKNERLVLLQLHGGGYIGGMRNAYRSFAGLYSELGRGMSVLTVDYRVAPEHPYPAAAEDAMKAWNYLMLLGYGARDVIITGDSAGGNLALSLVLKIKEQERLLPRGIVLMSPWTDLTGEGKTFQTKAELDPVLDKEYIDRMTRAYAPDRDLTDPYISPLFGDFHGFPPVYIQVGENEILLDDSLRLYKNLIKAGVAAHIDRFPGMWHVFQMSPFKKASEAMDKNAEFIYSVCR